MAGMITTKANARRECDARAPILVDNMAKYMVIETHREGCLREAYRRFHEKGRMMPAGLRYIDSWLEKDGNRCFQLMETEDPALFPQWTKNWEDLTHFEIIEIGPKPTA
jgi:hypothetical protein